MYFSQIWDIYIYIYHQIKKIFLCVNYFQVYFSLRNCLQILLFK